MLIDEGFADLALERVAARAGVGKATIYRRWASKEALALHLLMQLAAPHITIEDVGDTRAELLAAVTNALHAVTDTPFGPVIRALLSQIAINPLLGDPFRASVVQARRAEIARCGARRGPRRSTPGRRGRRGHRAASRTGLLPTHVRRGTDTQLCRASRSGRSFGLWRAQSASGTRGKTQIVKPFSGLSVPATRASVGVLGLLKRRGRAAASACGGRPHRVVRGAVTAAHVQGGR